MRADGQDRANSAGLRYLFGQRRSRRAERTVPGANMPCVRREPNDRARVRRQHRAAPGVRAMPSSRSQTQALSQVAAWCVRASQVCGCARIGWHGVWQEGVQERRTGEPRWPRDMHRNVFLPAASCLMCCPCVAHGVIRAESAPRRSGSARNSLRGGRAWPADPPFGAAGPGLFARARARASAASHGNFQPKSLRSLD
jgi:hypothetical protein